MQQGLVTRQQLRDAGLSRRRVQAVTSALVRVERGVYADRAPGSRPAHLVTGGVPAAAYVAEVRALLLALGPAARASRRTAAVLWGLDVLVEPALVELDVVGVAGTPRRTGVRVRRAQRSATALVVAVPGSAPLPVTPLVDTLLDIAEERPLAEAVAVVDSALRARRTTLRQVRRAVAARRGQPFAGRLRRVLRWADARSGSVLESALRVLLCEAGLVPPARQHVVRRADGTVVGRVDFAWPERRLVVETDGRRWHDPADARDRDRRRDNGCARAGYRVLRFTWAEVLHAPDDVVAAVREALRVPPAPGAVPGATGGALDAAAVAAGTAGGAAGPRGAAPGLAGRRAGRTTPRPPEGGRGVGRCGGG